jgi:hypothetical protein
VLTLGALTRTPLRADIVQAHVRCDFRRKRRRTVLPPPFRQPGLGICPLLLAVLVFPSLLRMPLLYYIFFTTCCTACLRAQCGAAVLDFSFFTSYYFVCPFFTTPLYYLLHCSLTSRVWLRHACLLQYLIYHCSVPNLPLTRRAGALQAAQATLTHTHAARLPGKGLVVLPDCYIYIYYIS